MKVIDCQRPLLAGMRSALQVCRSTPSPQIGDVAASGRADLEA